MLWGEVVNLSHDLWASLAKCIANALASDCQLSIIQSIFAAVSKYSVTVVNRQLWTGQ